MDAQPQGGNIHDFAEGPVKRKNLPIKQVIPLKELQNKIDSGKCKVDEATLAAHLDELATKGLFNVQLDHDEEEFYVFCSCSYCLKYREIILRLINDYFNMRNLWKALQKIVVKHYKPIIMSASANAAYLYKIWVEDDKFCWMINGVFDRTRVQHLQFISDLKFTENVVLVLFSTMFVAEDPHQLFELMSYQVECFARAYAAGLSDKISSLDKGQTSAEDAINYVLNGYEQMCKVADHMSRFLFSFELNHLKQFNLDWVLLNKRMYQKYVYGDFVVAMPKCIIKLKDEVSTDRYAQLVRKCIKFDEEMTEINRKWSDVWAALDQYHMTEEDQKRRQRLKAVSNIFEVIKEDISIPCVQFVDVPQWESHKDRQAVWQNMVACIKSGWPAADEFRLNATVSAELCKICNNNSQEFHIDGCSCVTCLIAGGPSVPKISRESKKEGICLKCSIIERAEKEGACYVPKVLSKSSPQKEEKSPSKEKDGGSSFKGDPTPPTTCETNVENFEPYHLSWIVFKHLKDRKPYPYTTIDEKKFCSNCKRTSCSLAKKFINREISYCLAHHLIKNFQPYSISLERLIETVPCVVKYNHKALAILHDPSNDDLVLLTLWTFITSSIAGCFSDVDADSARPELTHLKIVNNDIELPMLSIDEKVKSKKFIEFFGKTLGAAMTPRGLKEVLIKQLSARYAAKGEISKEAEDATKKVYEDPPVRLEPELIKPREVADLSKAKSACCGDQHCKENHLNRTCVHEKETTRISETRDRLRKKLSQLTSAKKNVKTINKTGPKSPLELIKVLNKNPPSLNSLSKEMAKIQNKANVTKEVTSKMVTKPPQEKEDKLPKPPVTKETKATNTVTQNELDTNDNLDEWVKDTLSFIEGCAEPKKVKNVPNNKKAAKKAKQKLRKEEQKRIEELVDVRAQFLDLYFKEFMSKNELKAQKAAKKKDKKRITDLESNIKKLGKAKSKIETSILELIATVKSANSEFKFSYLPTKEQQQEVLKRNIPGAEAPPVAPPVTPNPASNAKIKAPHETPPRVYYPTEPQFVPPSEFRSPPGHNIQIAYPPSLSNGLSDPAKGIVTIRRVNLPNVPEPQVTVTAKGASPDKDKLLYTFINGQLVPATSLDAQTLSVLQPTVFPIELKSGAQVQKKEALNVCPNVQKNSALPEEPVAKTKTQLKKERRRAKKLAAEAEQKVEEVKDVKKLPPNTKRVKSNSKETSVEQLTEKPKKTFNKELKPQSKCSSSDSGINSREHSVSNGKSKVVKSSKTIIESKVQPDKTKISKPVDESVEKTPDKQDVRHRKMVDNGQFDNNQFKMLHLDEFSSESEELINVPNKIKPKKVVQTKAESKNSQTNKNNKQTKPDKCEKPPRDRDTTQREVKPPRDRDTTQREAKPPRDRDTTQREAKPPRDRDATQREAKPPRDRDATQREAKPPRDRDTTQREAKPPRDTTQREAKPPRDRDITQREAKTPRDRDAIQREAKPPRDRDTTQRVAKSADQKTVAPKPTRSSVQSVILEENKKQKKKTSKKPNNKAILENCRSSDANIEKMKSQLEYAAGSLRQSMQKLSLNTKAKVTKECGENTASMSNLNVSIMEQLNRGVQVEDLTLPPGITLTKVDPSRAEALRAKTESIGKLSQPMQPQPQQNTVAPPIISPALLPHLGRFGAEKSDVIMLDTVDSKSLSDASPQSDGKKSKKNKRRSKKKKDENSPDESLTRQKNCESKMITLRNPMFHGPSMHVLSMPNNVPIPPLPMDQPAAIIKNENGMFTIRNPALHQAFSAGVQNSYRSYNPNFYSPTENCRNFSYFSDNISNSNQFSSGPVGGGGGGGGSGGGGGGPKCLSAIGSEIKTAQQQKKSGVQTGWPTQNNCPPQNKCGYIGEQNHYPSMQQKYQQSSYCNSFDVFSQSSAPNLFDNNTHDTAHNCDETPPPSRSGYNHYLDDIPNSSRGNKYDNMPFFRNLIPGQMLNSEVTIHNINESKFTPNSPLSHNVEITPISRPTSGMKNFNSEPQDSLQSKGYVGGGLGEYADNLFVPSQMLSLNDLDTDDREVESFKRFNYAFEPPKEKPKATINVNDLLAHKKPATACNSPYLDETLENFVRNMSSLEISDNAVNGNSQDANDRNTWW